MGCKKLLTVSCKKVLTVQCKKVLTVPCKKLLTMWLQNHLTTHSCSDNILIISLAKLSDWGMPP